MSNLQNVGIWGLGTYLPPQVRTNDWWPASIVDEWRMRLAKRFTHLDGISELSPGARLVMEAVAKYADDPFEGARERRIVDDDLLSTDMGIIAAKDAMERAGVGPGDIDFLLVQSLVSDYHNSPDGCRIHEQLGLPARCFTSTIDAACSGFLSQVVLAQGLIQSGLGKVGLLVQCSPVSRILRPSDPWSATLADAATAAVIGKVSEGHGVLGQAHATDGRFHGGLVTGVPGKRWYEDGAVSMYVEDHERARGMVMAIPDTVTALIEESLEGAGIDRAEVGFLAAHQATIWFGDVIQTHAGLRNARRVNTFPWTTSVAACNAPLVLSIAEKEGLLNDGDIAVVFSGASGMTAGAFVCRWGR